MMLAGYINISRYEMNPIFPQDDDAADAAAMNPIFPQDDAANAAAAMNPIPILPQDDAANAAERQAYLNNNRVLYNFDFNYLNPLPMLDTNPQKKKGVDIIPTIENFSSTYNAEKLAEAIVPLAPNLLLAKVRGIFDPFDKLDDYADDIFTTIPVPEVASRYTTDRSFADQRLAGVNPLVIKKVDHQSDLGGKIAAYLEANKEQFKPIDLIERLDKGHIYITDYTGNDPDYPTPKNIANGTFDSKLRKYLPKPRAFFCWRDVGIQDLGELIPIAIQLSGDDNSRIYTPSNDKEDWLYAKLCVQVADANHHEMATHLGRTHFAMEPFAVATARQLYKTHPLSLLLAPHFRFMIANNHLGRQQLVNPGGKVDEILAGSLTESLTITTDYCKRFYQDIDFLESSFPKDLENRHVDDKTHLPHYPYRDDGRLIWDAIFTYVGKYLNHFYQNVPTDITGDTELQGWANELATVAKVNGMPSSIDNTDILVKIVSHLIFTCGPLHSAVNYSQVDYMGFVPNQPLAAYLDPKPNPKEKPISEAEILKFLPPYSRTVDQLNTLYFLSAYHYDRLGYYDRTYQDLYQQSTAEIFAGTPIDTIVLEFQQELKQAGDEIDRRNRKRLIKYPYFHPNLITNSISV
jgi:arachidonate 15-lipoxygenase